MQPSIATSTPSGVMETAPLAPGARLDATWEHRAMLWRAPERFHGSLESSRMQRSFIEAIAGAGFDTEFEYAYAFQPHGTSLILSGPAYRLVAHTWPEHGLCTGDLTAVSLHAVRTVTEAIASTLKWTFSECHEFSRQ